MRRDCEKSMCEKQGGGLQLRTAGQRLTARAGAPALGVPESDGRVMVGKRDGSRANSVRTESSLVIRSGPTASAWSVAGGTEARTWQGQARLSARGWMRETILAPAPPLTPARP